MYCSYCESQDTKVIDSRLLLEGREVRRRRLCDSCGKRFTTYERAREELPMVLKSNGEKVKFSREKIGKGLKKALRKRPFSLEQVEELVENIEKKIIDKNLKMVTTETVGKAVMESLKSFDPVAYVRFASVYLEFKEIEDFISELRIKI